MKFGKKEKKDEKHACATCGVGHGIPLSNKEALKRLQEMEKRRAKPTPCPYIKDCTFKMLPEVGRIICLDQEDGRQSQAYMLHLSNHHMWEQCRNYVDRLRQEQGILPKDLVKALKNLGKKAKKK